MKPAGFAVRWVLLAFGGAALLGCSPAGRPATDRPNIVMLIGDDHGYSDFGFMGSKWVATPNLDRLAEEGITFELAHTTSSHCRPSLNTFLTGLLPFQWNHQLDQLRESEESFDENLAIEHFRTLPTLLAAEGYASFQAGKYWEGGFPAGGFTDGMTSGLDTTSQFGGEGLALGRETMEPVYRFIDSHADQPFFVWFAPLLPHLPHDAPEEYRALYEGKGLSQSARDYFANCSWYDDVAGQLLDFLAERDLTRNTLVIYASDNGWVQHPFAERTGPLEGFLGAAKGKLSLHDAGFRTPILLRWPGVIEPRRIPDQLISTADLVPTILDYAGIPAPTNLQGISLRPIIEGTAVAERPFVIGSLDALRRREPMVVTSFGELWARQDEMVRPAQAFHLRSREWHYLSFESENREELYDLVHDPNEDHDVSAKHPSQVARFRAEIEHWKTQVTQSPGAPN